MRLHRRRREDSDSPQYRAQIAELLTGCGIATCNPFGAFTKIPTRFRGDFERDDAARLALWQEIGAELLAEWISDQPGTRPFAWWRYDAPPERRRRIRPADPMTPLHERTVCPLGIAPEGPHVVIVDSDFESQAEYLARHNLLAPAEIELLDHQPATASATAAASN